MKKKLYDKLFTQAINETCDALGRGAFSFLPNIAGKTISRFLELCAENNICPMCGESVNECICEEENG